MNELLKPSARKEGLVIQEANDEILIYDLKTNKAHCLNQTAAFVWRTCDGNTPISQIAETFSRNVGSRVPPDMIWLAIEQLNERSLLAENITSKLNQQTRREAIKKIGLSLAVALPVIATLTAPTSVMAASSCRCPGGQSPECTTQVGCGSTCNTTTLLCGSPFGKSENSEDTPQGGSITIKR